MTTVPRMPEASATQNQARIARMEALLREAFDPSEVQITDDSHLHAGHAGAQTGKGHFSLRIRSTAFAGMTPVAAHRAVYAALGAMMQTDIHALAIDAAEK